MDQELTGFSDLLTPGAQRALKRAGQFAGDASRWMVELIDLLQALLEDPDTRAGEFLRQFGYDWNRRDFSVRPPGPEGPAATEDPLPPGQGARLAGIVRTVVQEAVVLARAERRDQLAGTEHLLVAMLRCDEEVTGRLKSAGLAVEAMIEAISRAAEAETAPIVPDGTLGTLDLTGSSDQVDLARILDASANRASEGLRVVEDYVRFVLEDPALTRRFKDVRHRLRASIRALKLDERIAARDTPRDVGAHLSTTTERFRENPRSVLAANCKRTAEALRSLEEYTKLTDVWLASRFEGLRYDVYTLEKLVLTAVRSFDVLGSARLYLLVGGLPTLGDLRWVVGEALEGGVQAVQLREKGITDRELLRRAEQVRRQTAESGARFFVNDRPDLARLAGADGVHLGQDDLEVQDARRIVGTRAIIGVSTHDEGQIDRGVLEGAGYLGVGPLFPSSTKTFESFVDLSLVSYAAEQAGIPWFAIGGIDSSNAEQVLEAGAKRIAVSSAIVHAPSPRAAARALRSRLDALDEEV